jgi:hypothetical protein
VLELRNVMGFELERIAAIVQAENRLEVLREEYHQGTSPKRSAEIIEEATKINDELRTHVREKMAVLKAFARDLDGQARRLRKLNADLNQTVLS